MNVEPAWIRTDGSIIPYVGSSHAESIRILLGLKGKKRFSFDIDYYVKLHRLVRVFTNDPIHTGFEITIKPTFEQIRVMEQIAGMYIKAVEISFIGKLDSKFSKLKSAKAIEGFFMKEFDLRQKD